MLAGNSIFADNYIFPGERVQFGLSSHPAVYGLQYVVKNPFIGGVILHL